MEGPCKVPGCFSAAMPFREEVRCQERCRGAATQDCLEDALCVGHRDGGLCTRSGCVITSGSGVAAPLGQGRESASAGSRDAQSPGALGRHTPHCVSCRVGLMRRAWEARGGAP